MNNRTTLLRTLAVAAAVGASASVVNADIFAYEGFNSPNIVGTSVPAPDGTALNLVSASGPGFSGAWTVANGAVENSVYESAGLSYPAYYAGAGGTYTAVGGNGRNATVSANNSRLRLDFDATAYSAIGGAGDIYLSFLAQRVGPTTSEHNPALDRDTNELVSEYPRGFGFKLMDAATGNSDAGKIGKGSWWNADGETYPETVGGMADTWSLAEFNDLNRAYSGGNFADGVDLVVLKISRIGATGTNLALWVNPVSDGTNITSWDGFVTGEWTDGGPQVLDWYGVGLDSGSQNTDRAGADWVVDEIYVANSFAEATGLPVPEPSTYALIFGILAAVGVFFHRRRKA